MKEPHVNGVGAATSLSPDSASAFMILHERLARASASTLMERYERAADEVLRHPCRSDDPMKIARNAAANARKVIRDHLRVVVAYDETLNEPSGYDPDIAAAEWRDWIDGSRFSARDKFVLHLLLEGWEAEEVAARLRVPLRRAQVYVSRARKHAREAWSQQ